MLHCVHMCQLTSMYSICDFVYTLFFSLYFFMFVKDIPPISSSKGWLTPITVHFVDCYLQLWF